jgi:hypothetical protein
MPSTWFSQFVWRGIYHDGLTTKCRAATLMALAGPTAAITADLFEKIAASATTHGQRLKLSLPLIDRQAEYDLTSVTGESKYVVPRIYFLIRVEIGLCECSIADRRHWAGAKAYALAPGEWP